MRNLLTLILFISCIEMNAQYTLVTNDYEETLNTKQVGNLLKVSCSELVLKDKALVNVFTTERFFYIFLGTNLHEFGIHLYEYKEEIIDDLLK